MYMTPQALYHTYDTGRLAEMCLPVRLVCTVSKNSYNAVHNKIIIGTAEILMTEHYF